MIATWRDKVHYDKFLKERLPMDAEFHKMWPETIHGVDKVCLILTLLIGSTGMLFSACDSTILMWMGWRSSEGLTL